jgi:hypothetical protein
MPHWTEISEQRHTAAEIKFLVDLDNAAAIRDWARARLAPDPFGEGPFRDTYRTTSLYFDTAADDVFHRRGSYGRSKYRIRRYGQSASVFLERKLKKHDLVSKRRSAIEMEELARLSAAEAEAHWPGFWFHRRVLARELHPVCRISYRRTALLGMNQGHGTIRLTLDDDLRLQPESRFTFHGGAGELFLEGRAILELKYQAEAPAVFRELMERFALIAEPVSKYRLGAQAWRPALQEAERGLHAQAV